MTINRTLMVSALFILVALVAAVWLYPRLPAQVPVHWNLHGQVDGTLPRLWGAAFPALIILALAGLTVLLPLISPRQFEIQPFAGAYGVMMLAIQGMMLAVGLAVLLAGAGYALPIPVIALLAVGVWATTWASCARTSSSAFARRGRWPAMQCGSARTGWPAGCSWPPAW